MRRVHREETERVGANRLGRNGMRGHVHREGLDGTGDGNEAWRTAERRKQTSYGRNRGPVDREGGGVPQNGGNRPPTVETGVLLIRRGVAYRKRRKRTSYGSNGGPVDREGCGVPQNGRNGLVLERYGRNRVLFIGRGVAYHKTGLHGILFISTIDLLQPPWATVDLLQPPRAPVHLASTARYSTGYCSPRPLHGLLFNHPSTG